MDSPLACSTACVWMWPLERTLAAIAEAGFPAAELMVTRNPDTQSAETAGRLAREAGLEISAVHAPMLLLTRGVWGPSHMDIIGRSVDLAARLGAGVVVIHPPYLWELRYQAWMMGKMPGYEPGVTVAVENMYSRWVRGRRLRGHRWVSPSDLSRFPHLTLDTSHCGAEGYDILEALDVAGSRTRHIHLSDSMGTQRDSHALPGKGVLALSDFLESASRLAPQASVSLEVDLTDLASDPPAVVEALRGARHFCEDCLGGRSSQSPDSPAR